jgi:hypothetical protein
LGDKARQATLRVVATYERANRMIIAEVDYTNYPSGIFSKQRGWFAIDEASGVATRPYWFRQSLVNEDNFYFGILQPILATHLQELLKGQTE